VQHPGLSVDERAYQQYQSLAQVVLDSADIATKSAEAAATASSDMRRATSELRDLTDNGHKKARLLLAVTGGVMIVSAGQAILTRAGEWVRYETPEDAEYIVAKAIADVHRGVTRSLERLHGQRQLPLASGPLHLVGFILCERGGEPIVEFTLRRALLERAEHEPVVGTGRDVREHVTPSGGADRRPAQAGLPAIVQCGDTCSIDPHDPERLSVCSQPIDVGTLREEC
jgi:hypothetical protein